MEEITKPQLFISINGQQVETLDDFWKEVENLSSSPNDHVESIVLQNVGLAGQRACRKLASTLTDSITTTDEETLNLKSLHLEDPKIGPRGIKILAEELFPKCRRLNVLDLAHCRLGHFGAQALVDNQLPTEFLKELNLKENNLGDDGVWKLTSGLFSQLTSLEKLDLSSNSITDNSLSEIGRCIPELCMLQVINLTKNKIKAMSIDGLIKGLQSTNESKLVELVLSRNQIEACGVLQLANLLQVSGCSLESLDLSHNCIGDEGVLTLAEALKNDNDTRSLKKLDVTFNEIGDSGTGSLVDLLDSINSTATDNEQPFVIELIKGNPSISPARIKIFDMILKHSQTRHQRSSVEATPLANKTPASFGVSSSSSLMGENLDSQTILFLRKEIATMKQKMESMENNMETRIREMEEKSAQERKEYLDLISSLRADLMSVKAQK